MRARKHHERDSVMPWVWRVTVRNYAGECHLEVVRNGKPVFAKVVTEVLAEIGSAVHHSVERGDTLEFVYQSGEVTIEEGRVASASELVEVFRTHLRL